MIAIVRILHIYGIDAETSRYWIWYITMVTKMAVHCRFNKIVLNQVFAVYKIILEHIQDHNLFSLKQHTKKLSSFSVYNYLSNIYHSFVDNSTWKCLVRMSSLQLK